MKCARTARLAVCVSATAKRTTTPVLGSKQAHLIHRPEREKQVLTVNQVALRFCGCYATDGEGQGGLACRIPRGRKEQDTAGRLNNNMQVAPFLCTEVSFIHKEMLRS